MDFFALAPDAECVLFALFSPLGAFDIVSVVPFFSFDLFEAWVTFGSAVIVFELDIELCDCCARFSSALMVSILGLSGTFPFDPTFDKGRVEILGIVGSGFAGPRDDDETTSFFAFISPMAKKIGEKRIVRMKRVLETNSHFNRDTKFYYFRRNIN